MPWAAILNTANVEPTRCRNTESGNHLVCFRPKNVVCDGEVQRLTAESGVQWETSCAVNLQCVSTIGLVLQATSGSLGKLSTASDYIMLVGDT